MKSLNLILISFIFLLINVNAIESNGALSDGLAQEKALQVLQTKCNTCHRKQNPLRVFKHKNMNRYSDRIYHQVFVWKNMPKGNEVKLSADEESVLKEWIQSIK